MTAVCVCPGRVRCGGGTWRSGGTQVRGEGGTGEKRGGEGGGGEGR